MAAAENYPCYNFEYKNYTGLGAFITSMCNVENNSSTYWMFYVNDQLADVGVSNYTVQPNDVIEMKYMDVNWHCEPIRETSYGILAFGIV